MISGWSERGYTQWWPVLGTTVIFSQIHTRLGDLGRGTCPPLSLSPPWHLSANHCSHLPPLQVPNWDAPHQCQRSHFPTLLSHCSYMLSWKSPVLWAEKVRELLPNTYCLEAVCVLAFYKYHSLEVFGGNTKINILIQWLLIPLKQMLSYISKCEIQQHSGSVTVLNMPSNIFNYFTYRWIKDFSPLKVFLEIDLMLLFSMNL